MSPWTFQVGLNVTVGGRNVKASLTGCGGGASPSLSANKYVYLPLIVAAHMMSDIWKFSPISNRYIWAIITRVAIFRQVNYFAVNGTRQNRWQFRRNSICFAEEKNFGIPFWTISQKRKTLGIPFQTIFRWEKTSEFCSESFLKEKNFGKRRLLLAAS